MIAARTSSRGIIHSLTGLGFQALVCGLLIWLNLIHPTDTLRSVFWTSVAGIFIWFHALVAYALMEKAMPSQRSPEEGLPCTEEPIPTTRVFGRIRFLQRIYQHLMLPVMELGMAAILAQSAFPKLASFSSNGMILSEGTLFLISVYAIGTFLIVIFSVYVTSVIDGNAWPDLKSGRNYVNLIIGMFLCLLAGACSSRLGLNQIGIAIDWILPAINVLLASEILFSMALRLISPRQRKAILRPAFDFYTLQAASQPKQVGDTFRHLLEGTFGFDVTQTPFGQMAAPLIIPAISLIVLLLLALSSLVIVRPYEQAIILNLGHLKPQPLPPGVHFKLPWPLASAQHYDIGQARSIHVGSHRPHRMGESIYREGVPILWTNMHGQSIDELLICSSPQDRPISSPYRGNKMWDDNKVPSVSLAAADIHVQFVISDLALYVRSSATPEAFLRNVAESCASRLIYRYDIDSLFCEARLDLVDTIRLSIQGACDRNHLGMRIVHVAITAVHPPVDVADAFEETVAALQERETKIQYAEQEAVRNQVETAGSREAFSALSALLETPGLDRQGNDANYGRLLHQCGGEISRVLSEAEAYRFSHENIVRGKTERFSGQLCAYTASPQNYLYDRYFSILEKGLLESRKIVLLGNKEKVILRMGLEEGDKMPPIPEETGH